MTTDRLSGIKERLAKATPGPWKICSDGRIDVHVSIEEEENTCTTIAEFDDDGYSGKLFLANRNDIDLVAHAPQDIADLLEEVERLREELSKKKTPTGDQFEREQVKKFFRELRRYEV